MRFRALGKIVNEPFERRHAAPEEEIEPRALYGYQSQLDKFAQPAALDLRRRPDRTARTDEGVECGNQGVAERRRSKHRVDVRQVVIHPRPVDAYDVAEGIVHSGDAVSRQPERTGEVPKVVCVTSARHRV